MNSNLQNNVAPSDNYTITDSEIEGLYYGVTTDKIEQRAWLLRIRKGKGELYMPPDKLIIQQVRISSEGHVDFQTETGLGDVIYNFTGKIASNSIKGEISILPKQSANISSSKLEVLLQKIDVSSMDNEDVSGLFSNVHYVEKGGDLVGTDLILFPLNGELIGVFTSYENEMIPYSVKAKQSGKEIDFSIYTKAGEQNFRGSILSQNIRLWRYGRDVDPKLTPSILPKTQKVSSILTSVKPQK
jgi:hypothetical protein